MRWLFYDGVRVLLWVGFRIGFHLEVRGHQHVPRSGPFILASNHLSYLDPPLLGAACPRRLSFLARADLFGHPLLAAFMHGVRVIPLQRGEADVGAVRHALQRLRQGEAVAIFPEGGRQLTGRLGRARRGVGLLARAARVPVVPALIEGTFEALGPHATWVSAAKIRVAFGPSIPYTERSSFQLLPSQEAGEIAAPSSRRRDELVAEAVTEAWHELRRKQIS